MKRLWPGMMLLALVADACTGTSTAPSSTTSSTTTTSTAGEFAATVTVDELGWSVVSLPDEIAAANGTITWTRDELIFWGGEDESTVGVSEGDPGLALSPTTWTWRRLPPSPREVTFGAAAVWNGSKVIICCGARSNETVAYEPVSNTWQTLADSPVRGEYAEAIWDSGDEVMLVVGSSGVARYDPFRDIWTEFSDPPIPLGRVNEIAWTGRELIIWPSEVERHVHSGIALDPATDTWRVLLDPPAWPAALGIEWTGDTLIIWGGLPANSGGSERAVGSRLDLENDQWLPLPEVLPEPDACECNLGSQQLVWTGSELLVWTGWLGSGLDPHDPLLISFRPDTDVWSLVDQSPTQWGGQAAMTDDRVAVRRGPISGSDQIAISPSGWQSHGTPLAPISK